MVWFDPSRDVKMVWFDPSRDVKIVWFDPSRDVKMVWFDPSRDVGLSLIFHSRDVYASRGTLHPSSSDDVSRVRPYASRVIWLRLSSKNLDLVI